jgi:hypothetical protein
MIQLFYPVRILIISRTEDISRNVISQLQGNTSKFRHVLFSNEKSEHIIPHKILSLICELKRDFEITEIQASSSSTYYTAMRKDLKKI